MIYFKIYPKCSRVPDFQQYRRCSTHQLKPSLNLCTKKLSMLLILCDYGAGIWFVTVLYYSIYKSTLWIKSDFINWERYYKDHIVRPRARRSRVTSILVSNKSFLSKIQRYPRSRETLLSLLIIRGEGHGYWQLSFLFDRNPTALEEQCRDSSL